MLARRTYMKRHIQVVSIVYRNIWKLRGQNGTPRLGWLKITELRYCGTSRYKQTNKMVVANQLNIVVVDELKKTATEKCSPRNSKDTLKGPLRSQAQA